MTFTQRPIRRICNPYPAGSRKAASYDWGYYFGQRQISLSDGCNFVGDHSVQFTEGHRYGQMDQDILLS